MTAADAAARNDPTCENAFGALRRARQTRNKNNFSADYGQSEAETILDGLTDKKMPQMDRSFQIRHFGEKVVGGFDFLAVFM